LDGFHLVFLKRFQVRCLLTRVELLVSQPCGKHKEHSFLQYTILEIWTFEIFTGKSISPNSLIPNAFRICFCLFIKSLIRLNLMQSSFDGVFKIFHIAVEATNIEKCLVILSSDREQPDARELKLYMWLQKPKFVETNVL